MSQQRAFSWPDRHQFALFLSHDVDQVYDRELFSILGTLNQLRRMWLRIDPRRCKECIKRLARSVFRPKDPLVQFKRILSIERYFSFRSTFYFLEDRTFNRYGGRYRYNDSTVKSIVRMVLDSGCEIGVHGSYYALDKPDVYRKQLESFENAFGIKPIGIRNHYLRHTGIKSWAAQSQAGFKYDGSFGFRDQVGIRKGRLFPFFPSELTENNTSIDRDFVAIPLTVMDSSLFRAMSLTPTKALNKCKELVTEIERDGGVLSLLWHNNYFDEPEFADWERVYEEILAFLKSRDVWNATGAEIASWWRTQKRRDSEHKENM